MRLTRALPLILFLFLIPFVLAQEETCAANDHYGCDGDVVYWYDSCGNKGNYVTTCSYGYECSGGACQLRCGNGQCDSSERCDTCPGDCGCGSYERCQYGDCQTWCGNGRCDGTESCSTCLLDCGCGSGQECAGGRCVSLCGNNRKDYGETCDTCPADFPCSGSHCLNGRCVECLNDAQCESRETYSGEFFCGPKNQKVLEKGTLTQGICQFNSCTGSPEAITKVKENCGEKLCQEGKCGCSEGYSPCLTTGKCERDHIKDANEACGCDHQCESGFCNGEVCIDVLNVILSSTKETLTVGEEMDITVSADNNLNEDVNINIALNIGNGLRLSGVHSGSDCSGNQCKLSKIVAGRGREKVTVTVVGEGASESAIGASVTYVAEGKERSITALEPLRLQVINCGDGVCSPGETYANCCGDCGCLHDTGIHTYGCAKPTDGCKKRIKPTVYIGIAFVWFLLILGYLFGMPAMRHKRQKEKEAEERRRKEEMEHRKRALELERIEHERDRIQHVLQDIKEEINPKKPPSAKTVLKTLKDKYDMDLEPELFGEEYFTFTQDLKQEAKEKRKDESKKQAKFCTKCGYRLRESVKFCTVCGHQVRFV